MDPITLITQGTLPLINAVISKLDDEAWKYLSPHENKIVCFCIDTLPPLYFQIHKEGLKCITFNEGAHIDVTFSGPFSAFITLIFTQHRIEQALHVRGDVDCAKALYDTWHSLNLDWEGYFATFLGGNLSHMMAQSIQHTQKWLHQNWENRVADFGAYLQDDEQLLPTSLEVEHWLADIDNLRSDVDRFEARLKYLEQRFSKDERY